jgi:hypothetical protein
MLLVVADTRHNRYILRLAADDLAGAFSVKGREALAPLRRGERPSGSAVVIF